MNPPIWLSFAPSDPTGGAGLQGDLLTGAALGTHVLTVLTAWLVRDSAALESVQRLTPDAIEDQARSLLEDMPVRAFKVGALFSAQAATVVARIAADYPAIPLVLHLGADELPQPGLVGDVADHENAARASLESLARHAHLVVISHRRLEHWFSEGWLGEDGIETAVQALMALGPDHVLITDVPHGDGRPVNVLASGGPEAEAWSWQRLPETFLGAGATLSAALTALLACGGPMRQVVIEAQQFTRHALQAGYQPGMGRSLPDRMFWRHRNSPSVRDRAN